MLSLGGKVVFLNAVLYSILLYYMSFILLRWARQKIDRIRKCFLWNGPMREGNKYPQRGRRVWGVGFKNFQFSYYCQIVVASPDQTRGIRPRAGSWNVKYRSPSTVSGLWKGILVSQSIVWPSLKHKLGDGGIAFF